MIQFNIQFKTISEIVIKKLIIHSTRILIQLKVYSTEYTVQSIPFRVQSILNTVEHLYGANDSSAIPGRNK